jgi:N-acetylglucosaminyldiphosphoundecaprenol N-acetyl-beta-D-mannosaminyltransferase
VAIRTKYWGALGDGVTRDTFRIGELELAVETLETTVSWVVRQALAENPCVVVTSHISHLMLAEKSLDFRDVILRSEMNVADGWPLVAASRILRPPLPSRVIGIDLVDRVLQSDVPMRIAILGGPPGTADAMAERERDRHEIAIVEPLPVGLWDAPDELQAMYARVARAQPNLVLIGLGVPKQEMLADALRPHVCGPILCCGAAVPVLGGYIRRAPKITRTLGIEWAFRIVQEPVRMFPRYVVTGSWFARVMVREIVHRVFDRG